MMLTPREIDKMYVFLAAQIARRRKEKRVKGLIIQNLWP